MRRRPIQPKGLRPCAVCGESLIWLHQHTRWLNGRPVTVCGTHWHMPEPEIYAFLQQRFPADTTSTSNPQEVG